MKTISLEKRPAIFLVDCWPDNQGKLNTLVDTIIQIKLFNYPVLVCSHFPLPAEIIEKADYYLYDKQDIMSGADRPMYWRTFSDGRIEKRLCRKEYQGVAALNNLRNGIDFCRAKWDWIYHMNADIEVDLEDWLNKVKASTKDIVCIPYEGVKNGIGGGLWAAKTEMFDKIIPYLTSWNQYAETNPDVRFIVERWQYQYVTSIIDPSEIDWIDIETYNRFDNVDRNVWEEEVA